jgi:aarF domain-containing kinase
MRPLSAPDSEKTYVYRDGASLNRAGKVDEFGLPLVYDKDLIQAYWKTQGNALTSRWTEFLGYAVPFLTRVITLLVSGGSGELKKNGASLAKDARIIFEKLVSGIPLHRCHGIIDCCTYYNHSNKTPYHRIKYLTM